ncbi:roadblock/LC7 domain-containing protein [Streptomyces niveus]|uniref:roadblock/LC7 domain-containing protein n=1 Tax=Streptomyces niveus TaxID=193462 RepID=UPI00344E82BD
MIRTRTPSPEVQKMLDARIQKITGVRGAVVLTEDGLALYWSLYDATTAERRAAVSSSLGSLALSVATDEEAGHVRRTLIEMEDGYFIIARCGLLSFLAVSTRADADLSVVGYELAELTRQLGDVLDAGDRRDAGPGGAPT